MKKLQIKAESKVVAKNFRGDSWVMEEKDIPFVASRPSHGMELLGELGYFYVIWRPSKESEQTEIITKTSMYSLLLMVAGGKKLSDIIIIASKVTEALTKGKEVWDNRKLWASGHNIPFK